MNRTSWIAAVTVSIATSIFVATFFANGSDIVTAVSGVVVALFTGTLFFTTHKLWLASEKQLEVTTRAVSAAEEANALTRQTFAADQRPWVSVSAKFDGPIDCRESYASANIVVSTKNYGKSPAFNVQDATDFKLMDDLPYATDAFKKFAKACKEEKYWSNGPLLFPGQESHSIEDLLLDTSRATDKSNVALNILVCVTYESAQGKKRFQTGLVLDVLRKPAGGRATPFGENGFDVTVGGIPAEVLELYIDPGHGTFAS